MEAIQCLLSCVKFRRNMRMNAKSHNIKHYGQYFSHIWLFEHQKSRQFDFSLRVHIIRYGFLKQKIIEENSLSLNQTKCIIYIIRSASSCSASVFDKTLNYSAEGSWNRTEGREKIKRIKIGWFDFNTAWLELWKRTHRIDPYNNAKLFSIYSSDFSIQVFVGFHSASYFWQTFSFPYFFTCFHCPTFNLNSVR